MARKADYAKLFTRRKDGTYQKVVDGKYLYSKDPEDLYRKWQALLQSPPSRSFKEVAKEWESKHRESIGVRTWANYSPHFESFLSLLGNRPIASVSARDIITDLNKAKAQNYSATIVKTRKTILTQILDHAVAKGDIEMNPALSVKLPKNLPKSKRSAPTEEEMKCILHSLDAPFGFFPFLLLCTGLRKSEALALEKGDVDLKGGTISVSKSLDYASNAHPVVKAPKTESGTRLVPILDLLRQPLQEHLNTLAGELLFPTPKSNRNPGGGYMTERSYEIAWNAYCKATGLNLTAHQLRHGTATLMFEAGVDEYTAQKILGHANVATTIGIYTELRDKQKVKSIAKLNEEMKKYGRWKSSAGLGNK